MTVSKEKFLFRPLFSENTSPALRSMRIPFGTSDIRSDFSISKVVEVGSELSAKEDGAIQKHQYLQILWEESDLLEHADSTKKRNATVVPYLRRPEKKRMASSDADKALWGSLRINDTLYDEFVNLLRHDVFEPDYFCESERFFLDKLFSKNKLHAMQYLSQAFSDYVQDEHMKEGILHIISGMDYDEVYPNGQVIAQAVSSTKSPVLQELVIRCYEHWGKADGIRFLREIDPLNNELDEYIRMVIRDLEG